jgi:hypothetical protein
VWKCPTDKICTNNLETVNELMEKPEDKTNNIAKETSYTTHFTWYNEFSISRFCSSGIPHCATR